MSTGFRLECSVVVSAKGGRSRTKGTVEEHWSGKRRDVPRLEAALDALTTPSTVGPFVGEFVARIVVVATDPDEDGFRLAV